MAEIYRILDTSRRESPACPVWLEPGRPMYAGAGQAFALLVHERDGDWEVELHHLHFRGAAVEAVQTRIWRHEPGHPLNGLPILGLELFPRAIHLDHRGRPRRLLVEMAIARDPAALLRPDSHSHEADRR